MTVVDMVSINELMRIRHWADQKIQAGEEPPWAWYQYMKLREVLDAIIAGMGVVAADPNVQGVGSQGVGSPPGPPSGPPVTLPMG